MRLAVISDIHSNLEALTAVLAEADARGAAKIYCLGDVVGYGADPEGCVDLVRLHCAGTVLGNHDQATVDESFEYHLPRPGMMAVRHNRERLSEEQLDFLAALPLLIEEDGCTFVHATPEEPAAWHRIGPFELTRRQFKHFQTDVCFVGHTHVPGLVSDRIGTVQMRRGNRYLINVGSVGRPRDGDARACLVLFDTEAFTWDLVRVRYDAEAAAEKILQAGLPEALADGLLIGR